MRPFERKIGISSESGIVALMGDIGAGEVMVLQEIRYCARSDTGRRKTNEDAFFAGAAGSLYVFAVADGLGGHAGGSMASSMAINALVDAILRGGDHPDTASLLRQAFMRANGDILAYNVKHGMNAGTTLVAAAVDRQGRCTIANTGDSRAYIVTGDRLWHTTDHSYVQELVDRGFVDADQAMSHPRKNVLTEALGLSEQIRIDTKSMSAENAILLLCSDGLHGFVRSARLQQVLQSVDPEEACAALVAEATKEGSNDNITVIVARIPPFR